MPRRRCTVGATIYAMLHVGNIVAIGGDIDTQGAIRTGSVLVDGLTIAGN